jgi:hypothetical protein
MCTYVYAYMYTYICCIDLSSEGKFENLVCQDTMKDKF